jgi:hypothetical protein
VAACAGTARVVAGAGSALADCATTPLATAIASAPALSAIFSVLVICIISCGGPAAFL